MRRGLVLALLAALTTIPLAGAAAEPRPAGSPPVPEGVKLATHVMNPKKLGRSVTATRRILALSGIATVREGQELVAGVEPLSRWRMTARETVLLAKGTRRAR